MAGPIAAQTDQQLVFIALRATLATALAIVTGPLAIRIFSNQLPLAGRLQTRCMEGFRTFVA
jgi:hypothetical protein